ncbi:MAG: hypothetical protein AB7S65_09305 [Sulfuricurvum sp.]
MDGLERFRSVNPVVMMDPLLETLGVSSEGVLTYEYKDMLKLAGHSCPTVAGVFLMVREALARLYPDSIPVRGEIAVWIRGRLGEGTVGVVANVASMITGAADIGGFQGLNGMYDRRGLLHFDAQMSDDMVFERLDTRKKIGVRYNPAMVSADPRTFEWMKKITNNSANEEERRAFGEAWQDRVWKILTSYADYPGLLEFHDNDLNPVLSNTIKETV